MTIEYQIRDEKLQYDINKETSKILALSSGKIDKYEYLTGEEILSYNQQQIIEKAKLTYSPLGKAFEKQTKAIKDQGEKQIKAIQDNKEQLVNINNDDDYKNKLLLSREREIFKNIYNKRLDKIEELSRKIDYNNQQNTVISSSKEFEFDKSEDPLVFLNDTEKGKISLEEAKNLQQDYDKCLKEVRKGNKSVEQKKTLADINVLFNARNNAIKFIEDYGSMILEAKRLAKQEGTGLKILTLEQLLQQLPITLAQIKAGNNSQSLLNEITWIGYSLYQSKEITKKVFNNIIKSIKV